MRNGNFLTLLNHTDKKNENKEVAVNEFLPSGVALEAIQYSMQVFQSDAMNSTF